MSSYTTREGPNPLRPYYIPPSIGLEGPPPNVSAKAAAAASSSTGASAFFSDLDYSDYLSDGSPSATDSIKSLFDQALWKYTSVLMAQPFEVAKTILQVYVAQDLQEGTTSPQTPRRGSSHRSERYDPESLMSDDEDDEASYFSSTAPMSPATPSSTRSRRQHHVTDRSGYIPQPKSSPHALTIKNPASLMDALQALWANSGPASIWKAANSTFIYSVLLKTFDSFFRGLFSAILGLPDEATGVDLLTSISPGATLAVTVASTSLSALLLSPIDTTRTLLILTPLAQAPRSLFRAIRTLPDPYYIIPPHLVPITFLHSTLPTLISSATPVFLKQYLSLDPLINPSSWSICTFLAAGAEMGLRFPLETVLRRAQIATFLSPSLRNNKISNSYNTLPTTRPRNPKQAARDAQNKPIETIVPVPHTYRGIVGTIWSIVYEEGTTPILLPSTPLMSEKKLPPRRTRGQGIEGLYRGWRVGMWGLVGVWGAGFIGAVGGGAVDVGGPVPDAGVGMGAAGVGSRVGGSGSGRF